MEGKNRGGTMHIMCIITMLLLQTSVIRLTSARTHPSVVCNSGIASYGRSAAAFASQFLPCSSMTRSSSTIRGQPSSPRHHLSSSPINTSRTRVHPIHYQSKNTQLFVKVDTGINEERSPSPPSIFDDEALQEAYDTLQPHFSFPLDSWQLSAGSALLNNQNVIVCAPTGAGKTVVGEMALRIALERDTKAIYTTPLKALSNQKFGEMRQVFGVDKVGLTTGDVSIRRGSDVTIMTTEVYRNMAWKARTSTMDAEAAVLNKGSDDSVPINSSSLENARSNEKRDEYGDLTKNSIVVLDEFHYMGQKGRGSTWEECVITNPSHTQIVGLSATLPNAHRLAAWMESVTGRKTVLIEAGGQRPVPLRYYFVTKRDFSPLFRDEDAGPGSPHGLLGLRGDGVELTPKKMKKKKLTDGAFGKDNSLFQEIGNGLPLGLDLHPTLQKAAERRLASIDRRIQRIVDRETQDDYDSYSRGSPMSAREQRRAKEQMLKAELRKSVPSVAAMIGRLQDDDLLPAIFFIFSRNGCDNAAQVLCESLKTSAEERAAKKNERPERRNWKGTMLKGKGRGRGRRHTDSNEWDLNVDELAMIQDEDGRNFRADLLDQLLSDDYDSPNKQRIPLGVEDEEFLSDENLRQYSDLGLLTFVQTKEVAYRVLTFNTENPEIAFSDAWVERLLLGVGSHHAGILPAHKAFIETLFRLELMKVVFATETLAAGINMPARTTVVCSMAKRGDNGMDLLETSNLLQMAGRAGRRGMDTQGACVIAATPFEGPEEAIKILTDEIKPVVSQFAPSYALAINLIERGSGMLDVAKSMVQKSFGVWESQQREKDLASAMRVLDAYDTEASPQEQFLNALQLTLEKELSEARAGTSPTGTSQSKISKLEALVDVLADGKKLKKVSKKYSGSASLLDLEQSTLQYLEQELRTMESANAELDLPVEFVDEDTKAMMSEIRRQRQRVMKGETEVNSNILSAMAKVATNRMKDGADGAEILRKALAAARTIDGEYSLFPDGAPLEPGELNEYIKQSSKKNRAPMLDLTTSTSSDDYEDDSWSQMLALTTVLEAYGCLVPLQSDAYVGGHDNQQYEVTSGGTHVGSLGIDNSLWQVCALGGAWDVAYKSVELDKFRDAIADFELDNEESHDEESDSDNDSIPKPQQEAETLTSYLLKLSSSEMAGYVSTLVIDSPRQSDSALLSFQKLSNNQQRAVQGALLSLERLVEVQRRLSLDDSIGRVQLELCACDVVTAWASGASWKEVLEMSGSAPGDLVRTLSRALDALRQIANLPFVPARGFEGDGVTVRLEANGVHPRIRALCRAAANDMDRYPVKDDLPFAVDAEDEEESESDDAEQEEGDVAENDEEEEVGGAI